MIMLLEVNNSSGYCSLKSQSLKVSKEDSAVFYDKPTTNNKSSNGIVVFIRALIFIFSLYILAPPSNDAFANALQDFLSSNYNIKSTVEEDASKISKGISKIDKELSKDVSAAGKELRKDVDNVDKAVNTGLQAVSDGINKYSGDSIVSICENGNLDTCGDAYGIFPITPEDSMDLKKMYAQKKKYGLDDLRKLFGVSIVNGRLQNTTSVNKEKDPDYTILTTVETEEINDIEKGRPMTIRCRNGNCSPYVKPLMDVQVSLGANGGVNYAGTMTFDYADLTTSRGLDNLSTYSVGPSLGVSTLVNVTDRFSVMLKLAGSAQFELGGTYTNASNGTGGAASNNGFLGGSGMTQIGIGYDVGYWKQGRYRLGLYGGFEGGYGNWQNGFNAFGGSTPYQLGMLGSFAATDGFFGVRSILNDADAKGQWILEAYLNGGEAFYTQPGGTIFDGLLGTVNFDKKNSPMVGGSFNIERRQYLTSALYLGVFLRGNINTMALMPNESLIPASVLDTTIESDYQQLATDLKNENNFYQTSVAGMSQSYADLQSSYSTLYQEFSQVYNGGITTTGGINTAIGNVESDAKAIQNFVKGLNPNLIINNPTISNDIQNFVNGLTPEQTTALQADLVNLQTFINGLDPTVSNKKYISDAIQNFVNGLTPDQAAALHADVQTFIDGLPDSDSSEYISNEIKAAINALTPEQISTAQTYKQELYDLVNSLDPTALATIQARIASIQASVNGLTPDQISTIQSDQVLLHNFIDALDPSNVDLAKDVILINSYSSDINFAFKMMNWEYTQISALTSDMNTLAGTMSTDITEIAGSQPTVATAVAKIQTDFGAIQTNVSTISSNISSYSGSTVNFSTINQETSQLSTDLNQLNTDTGTASTAMNQVSNDIGLMNNYISVHSASRCSVQSNGLDCEGLTNASIFSLYKSVPIGQDVGYAYADMKVVGTDMTSVENDMSAISSTINTYESIMDPSANTYVENISKAAADITKQWGIITNAINSSSSSTAQEIIADGTTMSTDAKYLVELINGMNHTATTITNDLTDINDRISDIATLLGTNSTTQNSNIETLQQDSNTLAADLKLLNSDLNQADFFACMVGNGSMSSCASQTMVTDFDAVKADVNTLRNEVQSFESGIAPYAQIVKNDMNAIQSEISTAKSGGSLNDGGTGILSFYLHGVLGVSFGTAF